MPTGDGSSVKVASFKVSPLVYIKLTKFNQNRVYPDHLEKLSCLKTLNHICKNVTMPGNTEGCRDGFLTTFGSLHSAYFILWVLWKAA